MFLRVVVEICQRLEVADHACDLGRVERTPIVPVLQRLLLDFLPKVTCCCRAKLVSENIAPDTRPSRSALEAFSILSRNRNHPLS